MKRPPFSFLAALALATGLVGPALGAKTVVAVAPADVMEVKTLDEIVVSGERDSLSAARTAIVEAEDRFHARFNALNKDHDYEIICRLETPPNHGYSTRFATRVCIPKIVDDLTHDDAGRLSTIGGTTDSTGLTGNVNISSTNAMRLVYQAELKNRVSEMVRKDPELLRALLERARLEQHYDELRRKKFNGRLMVLD